jgi:hypothetical protein
MNKSRRPISTPQVRPSACLLPAEAEHLLGQSIAGCDPQRNKRYLMLKIAFTAFL